MYKLIFLFFLLIQITAYSQFTPKKYAQKDGLSSYNIRQIEKDKNGFLWITTQDGLNKFDGTTFTTFTKDNKNTTRRIDFTDCRSLYYDSIANELWVLGTEFGINIINCQTNTVINRYKINLNNKNSFLICFSKQGNNLWIGSSHGLYLFDMITHTSKHYDISSYTNSALRINTISVDIYENIWLGINNFGLVVLNTATKQVQKSVTYSKLGFVNNNYTSTNFYFNKNEVTICTEQNAKTIIFDINYNCTINTISLLNRKMGVKGIYNINNNIYLCENGLYQLGDIEINKLDNDDTETSDWLKSINCITSIDNNLMALGCKDGIVIYDNSPQAIQAIKNNQLFYKNNLSHLYSIEKYNDNELLIGSENGLFILQNKLQLIPILIGVPFYNILKLEDNFCIVSNRHGIKLIKNKTIYPIATIYKEFESYENYQFNKLTNLNNDTAIISTENEKGLLLWDKKNHQLTAINTTSRGLYTKSNSFNTIYKDSDNRIWALSDYSISILNFVTNKTTVLEYSTTKNGISLGLFFDMAEVDNKTYWINCYGNGIVILDKGFKIINKLSEQNGLCNNGLYKIFTQKNIVVASSNNGISIIDKNSKAITNLYSESNNLHNNGFEEACGTMVNNTVYLGGINGFSMINLDKLGSNKIAPTLYFNNISITNNSKQEDTTNLSIQSITIPNNYTQIKVSFVGLNYYNPTRVNYWYRILEFGNDWINLKNQNFVDLIGLKHGTYTLQIKAANEDGVECAPKELKIKILPYWYQTLLFKILTTLAILSLLYILYSFRIRQLKRILTVRQKISANLHDDIGSTLSSINMYSQIAQLKPSDAQHIQTIQQNTQEALQKLDDIVWATNPKNDQIKNLVERINNFSKELLQAKNVHFIFEYHEAIANTKINEATRQNLFLICKEAVNNIAKYAQAKNCTISLSIKNKTIYCAIIDDGIGFDTSKPTERNGLLNMQLRTKQLNGKFAIDSVPNKGTIINVQLPL